MLRFTRNRWWAFVLALCLFAVCSLLLTAQALAYTGCKPISPQQPVPLPSYGDPDVPMGPGDGRTSYVTRGGAEGSRVVQQNGACPAGDGVAPISVAMDRLRLIVLGLRGFYLRF